MTNSLSLVGVSKNFGGAHALTNVDLSIAPGRIHALVDAPLKVSEEALREHLARHLVQYKIPKSFVRTAKIVRSPAGKADYRWAKEVATTADATA